MEILKLEINNFLTISHAQLDLQNKGLVLLTGENADEPSATSNGAGKSSIADAIYWALYGETARDESGDNVVNNVAKKNCFVQIELQDGDVIYQITRYRKHAIHKNSTLIFATDNKPGAASISLEKGTEKETQEVINGIMGCSKEVFSASIYAGQEMMPDLPKMTDKQLKMLIEEASGTERLEKAYGVASRKTLAVKVLMESAANQRASSEARLASLTLRIKTGAYEYKEFESSRTDRVSGFNGEIASLKNEDNAIVADLAKLPDLTAINAGLNTISDKLASHGAILAKRVPLATLLKNSESAEASIRYTISNAQKTVSRHEYTLANAATEMAKPCSECGKPHTADELEDYKAHVNLSLKSAKEELATEEAKLKSAQALVETCTADLAAFEATIPDVSLLTSKQVQLNTAKLQIERLLDKRSTILNAITRAEDKITEAKTGPNPQKAVLTMLATDKAKEEATIKDLTIKVAKLESEFEIAEQVQKVFSPAGVRAHILDTVTPFLNDRTAEYLSALSDGSISAIWSTLAETTKGEAREKFNIEVENATGAKSFKGLSGGEKRKVRIATMLALQDLVASRATKPINLWIGDEVDDALDPAGLERLMGIMEKKARERGTVLVISHADLTDWIDSVATVRKEGGTSTVSGVLSV